MESWFAWAKSSCLAVHTNKNNFTFVSAFCLHESQCCIPALSGISRMLDEFNPFGMLGTQRSNDIYGSSTQNSITRINSPGQRFTATHGITARAGEKKLFLFVVDKDDVNYMAVSSNVALEGTRGGPERYELYMKYGEPPSTNNYDQKSVLTASDSYVGDVLYR